jgi:hypothetical protein
MKKRLKSYIAIGLVFSLMTSCKNVLNVNPKGVITEDQISDPKYVDGLVTAAYALIPRAGAFDTMNPWIASLRSDDAYKGGGGLDDQPAWYQMESFSTVTPNVGNNDGVWFSGYSGISRANAAINAINSVDEADYPLKKVRLAEMYFIRGWIHFKLKNRFRWIPYIDENATVDDIPTITNHPEGDDTQNDLELWQKILNDFKFAAENLPEKQPQVGRANKYAAEAYAAKTLLWMAYPQDSRNQPTAISQEKLNESLKYINSIIESGNYSLSSDFAYNFMLEYDNNTPESIWELQFTIDDGTPRGNLNEGNGLTAPWWNPYFSCCDFHKASYNMVNAFRVDSDGLPLFDIFNEAEITNKDEYFSSNSFDPRLGHTVAIPGFPWKYQDILYDSAGTRQPSTYGYMHSMKENVTTNSPGLYDAFWMFNSKNQAEIRYAEVLLWKAEILIQLDRHTEALPIINQIRERASNSKSKLKLPNGNYPTNYKVEPYVDGVNCNWDRSFAWEALIWENRLEMAMEGRRFYDIVRWGIAEKVMNAYFDKETPRRTWYNGAHFSAGRDEYLPIPQAQMNWSRGVYKQNVGY